MYKNVNGKLIEMTEAEIAEEKQKIQLAKAEEKIPPSHRGKPTVNIPVILRITYR